MKNKLASLIIITFISAISHAEPPSWDVDQNNQVDALTDGLMLMRYLFDMRGNNLTLDAKAEDSPLTESEIISSISTTMTILDIDLDGRKDALTDGLMLMRYLFGVSGENLIDSAISVGAIRNSYQDITTYISNHMPGNIGSDEDDDGYENQSDQNRVQFQYKEKTEKLPIIHYHRNGDFTSPQPSNNPQPMKKFLASGMHHFYDENNFIQSLASLELSEEMKLKYNLDQRYPEFISKNSIVTIKTSHGDGNGYPCQPSTFSQKGNDISLLFLKLDIYSEKVFFREYKPNNGHRSDLAGCFTVLEVDGFFVALRNAYINRIIDDEEYFIEVIEALKIDFDGTLVKSKIFETNCSPRIQSEPTRPGGVTIYNHYNDLIISSCNSYLAIDFESFSLREPFSIEVDDRTISTNWPSPRIWENYNEGKPFKAAGNFSDFSQDLSHLDEKFQFTSGEYFFELERNYDDGIYQEWNAYINDDYASGVYSALSWGELLKKAWTIDENTSVVTETFFGINNHPIMYKYETRNNKNYYADSELNFGYLDDDLDNLYSLDGSYFPEVPYAPGEIFPLLLRASDNFDSNTIIYLDENGQHPGCTKPVDIVTETAELLVREKPVEIIKFPIPDESDLNVTVTSGEADVIITPYEYRAPVLCSEYKVNIDQIFSLQNSDTRPSISPRLDAVYERTLVEQPANGTYDVVQNTYTPDLGFEGKDMFKILIDDKTGDTQVVTIDVDVY